MNTPVPSYHPEKLPRPGDWNAVDYEEAFDKYFDAMAEMLGPDREGYRNHCLRAFLNFRALAPDLDPTPVVPALVFHDIALWSHRTVDYIAPSSELAAAHLRDVGREDWVDPVVAMIDWHHKQRRYTGPHADYADPVRRADMGDFTFGLQGRVPRAALRQGRAKYPNAGFHKMLLKRTLGRLCQKPWSPLPMMRW